MDEFQEAMDEERAERLRKSLRNKQRAENRANEDRKRTQGLEDAAHSSVELEETAMKRAQYLEDAIKKRAQNMEEAEVRRKERREERKREMAFELSAQKYAEVTAMSTPPVATGTPPDPSSNLERVPVDSPIEDDVRRSQEKEESIEKGESAEKEESIEKEESAERTNPQIGRIRRKNESAIRTIPQRYESIEIAIPSQVERDPAGIR